MRTSRKRKTSLALVLLAAVGLAACSSNGSPAPVPSAGGATSPSLAGPRWECIRLTTPNGHIDIEAPERYTLEFAADGRFAGQADCNQLFGQYTVHGQQIALSGIGSTKMRCPPGGHFDRFIRDLGQVTVFRILEGGDLILEGPENSGTLRFRAGTAR